MSSPDRVRDNLSPTIVDSVLVSCGHAITVSEERSGDWLGHALWTCSRVLFRWLDDGSIKQDWWRGKRVLDLGAGTGAVSALLHKLGAEVVATDQEVILPNLRHNLQNNGCADVPVVSHSWGSEETAPRGPFHAVTGGDLIYNHTTHTALIATLHLVCDPQTEIFLFFEDRRKQEQDFFRSFANAGFAVTKADSCTHFMCDGPDEQPYDDCKCEPGRPQHTEDFYIVCARYIGAAQTVYNFRDPHPPSVPRADLASMPIPVAVNQVFTQTLVPAAAAEEADANNADDEAPELQVALEWVETHVPAHLVRDGTEAALSNADITALARSGLAMEEATRTYTFGSETIDIAAVSGFHVGSVVWGAAAALAAHLLAHRDMCADKWVLEVGSGLGLAGIAAARVGGHVTLTDVPELYRLLSQNVRANERPGHPPAHVAVLRWGDATDEFMLAADVQRSRAAALAATGGDRGADTTTDSGFDVILGADVTYNLNLVEILVPCLAKVARAGTHVLIAHAHRDSATAQVRALFERAFVLNSETTIESGILLWDYQLQNGGGE